MIRKIPVWWPILGPLLLIETNVCQKEAEDGLYRLIKPNVRLYPESMSLTLLWRMLQNRPRFHDIGVVPK